MTTNIITPITIESRIQILKMEREAKGMNQKKTLAIATARLREIVEEGELARILETARVPGEMYYSRRLVSQEDRLKAGVILKEVAQIAFDSACSKSRLVSFTAYRMYMKYRMYAEYEGMEKDLTQLQNLERQRRRMSGTGSFLTFE